MLSFFIRPYKKIAIFVGITSKIKSYGKEKRTKKRDQFHLE